jgi:hypothetical protein
MRIRLAVPATVLALAASAVIGMPSAKAATPLQVANFNQSVTADPTTTAAFAWHLPKASSTAKAKAQQTVFAWGPSGIFSCETAEFADFPLASATVASYVAYFDSPMLSGLTPGTDYQGCAIDNTGARSATYSFSTAPATQDSVTVLAFGNANWRSTSSYQNYFGDTVAAARQAYPQADFLVHTGVVGSSQDQKHWDGFFTESQNAMAGIPWAPTPHSSNSYFTYNTNLPVGTSATQTANYAVRQGNLLYLSINAYLTTTAQRNATLAWIDDQLVGLPADTWIIAAIPGQFYGASSPSSTYRTELRNKFADIGVALVLQGSTQAYTRSLPIGGPAGDQIQWDYPSQNTISNADGVVYVTPGASGIQQLNPYPAATTSRDAWLTKWTQFGTPTAVAQSAGAKTYTAITVDADSIQVKATSVDGSFTDEFTINREPRPAVAPRELTPVNLNNGFGDDAQTQRVITWLGADSAKYSAPSISYSPVGQPLDSTVDSTIKNLGSPLASYTAYTTTLKDLNPGTTYQYRLNATALSAHGTPQTWQSPVYTFTTAPATDQPFTFLDFADSQGDSGTYADYWAHSLAAGLAAVPDAPFVLQNGDMADSGSHYPAWAQANGTLLSSVAFNPVVGNHDHGYQTVLDDALVRTNTDLPGPFPFTYYFVYGDALFLNLNTFGAGASSSDVKKLATWIRQVVEAHGSDSDGTDRWLIVTEHKSPYGGRWAGSSVTSAGSFGSGTLRSGLTPVYDELGVDLVLAGHDHNLIRSYPITWDAAARRAVIDRTAGDVTHADDGTIFFIPRNSGEKTYDLTSTSTTTRPWIHKLTNLGESGSIRTANPDLNVFAAVTVSPDSLVVNAYTAGSPDTPVDSFTILR